MRGLAPKLAPELARGLIVGLGAFCAVVAPESAWAGSNEITLQRLGTCVPGAGGDGCVNVVRNDVAFEGLTRDLSLVLMPKRGATPETLGEAGFAFQIDHNVSVIDRGADYWKLADVDGDPSGTLSVTQFHFRKGLPASFELGGILSVLWNSGLVAVGTELKWAFHEDYFWPVPDLALRAYVNTVLGSPQLNLTNAGADVVVGVPIGVANVMNITPYAGYNLNVAIAASRLIDATPTDSSPPVVVPGGESNQPEFAFPVTTQVLHQGIGGIRFQFAVTNVSFEATIAQKVQTYGFNLGVEF